MLLEIFLIYTSIATAIYCILIGYCLEMGKKDLFKDNFLGDGVNKKPTIIIRDDILWQN